MKSLMLKLLTILMISSSLFANKAKVLDFLKASMDGGEKYAIENISIYASTTVKEARGWTAYFVKIELMLLAQNKKIVLRDTVFSNGKVVSKKMNLLKNGKDLKNLVSPEVDPVLYDKEHLLAGNFQAPNKLLVFSEPFCPFCLDFLPELLDFVEKNKNHFALFYYHKPLTSLHPSAVGLIKAMEVAKKKGMKDVVKRTYEEIFDLDTKDEEIIVKTFNKAFGQKVSVDEMNSPDILKAIEHDIEVSKEMMISGTPTLFVNGKRDNTREKYKKDVK